MNINALKKKYLFPFALDSSLIRCSLDLENKWAKH